MSGQNGGLTRPIELPNRYPTPATWPGSGSQVPDDPYDRFRWKETRPGTWERDVDEVQQFYATLAKLYEGTRRMYFAITGHISLIVTVPDGASRHDTEHRVEDALRQAWLRVRYEQPTIASRVSFDEAAGRLKQTYQMFQDDTGPRSLEEWLERTFVIVPNGQTGVSWCNSDPPAPKYPTLFILTPPGPHPNTVRRDVVLRAPHDVIDGIGTLHLFNNLIGHAANAFRMQLSYASPVFGSEWANLSPPLRVAAAIPPELTAQQKSRIVGMTMRNAAARADVEIASLPFRQGCVTPGRHQRVALRLSPEESSRLLKACKAVGVTATHVFHAAIAMRVRDLQRRTEKERKVRYVNYALVNERSHCLPPYNSAQHAASVYHSVTGRGLWVDLFVPSADKRGDEALAGGRRREEFRRVVERIKDFYLDIRDDPDHIAMIPTIYASFIPPWPMRSVIYRSPPTVPPPKPQASVSISSMGLVDQIIAPQQGAFEVHNPWVTGEELDTGLGLFLATFRGELEVSAAYNAAWHEQDEVMSFLTDCKDEVCRGLGI